MGIAYENMPKEMLTQFRNDMKTLPYSEFLKWPPKEVQQVIALIVADFEAIMLPDEHMDLRNAYLASPDNTDRQRILYEHYQAALKRRDADSR
jgi:hypothetical protein